MKNLRVLIFPLATLTFSLAAHAAPVQYQLTAYHTSEISTAAGSSQSTPINSTDYFFADGTPITVTFYYDSAVAATSTNVPVTLSGSFGTYTALRSTYLAISNLTFEIADHFISVPQAFTAVFDADSTSDISRDSIQSFSISDNFNQLVFGDYKATNANIIFGGYNNMLFDQSLPNALTELNSYFTGISVSFQSGNNSRGVTFSNGFISQVPLPSSALFFLSGLVGLGANAARKFKR